MLSRVTVRDADFRRVTFDQFAPEGCTFERCDFSGQTLDRRYQPLFSSRKQSVFRDCRFDNADLTGVRPGQARFERCTSTTRGSTHGSPSPPSSSIATSPGASLKRASMDGPGGAARTSSTRHER